MQSLEQFLIDHAVPFQKGGSHHHVRPGWIGIDCPFCFSSKGKWHLGINESVGAGSCWKCGPHSLQSILVRLLGVSQSQAHKQVLSLGLRSASHTAKVRGDYKPPKGIGPLLDCHKKYLRDVRRFDPDEIERLWNVQGIGLHNRYGWRLFIPIIENCDPISWTTRSIGDAEPRYLNADATQESKSPKDTLYGIDYVRDTIIVHEGPTDVWRTGPGAVATMGLQHTSAQVALIARYPKRGICFDNSRDAQRRARILADQLSLLPGKTFLFSIDSDDPGNATPKEQRFFRRFLGDF